MARTDRGNSAAANVLSNPVGRSPKTKETLGRVVSIVLDATHPRFKELGEWNGLGAIEYTLVDKPTPPNTILPIAKPSSPNLKNYPILNEIVLISNLPNTDIGQFASSRIPYYTTLVALWNHPHHNAFPQNDNILPPSQQKDYIQTQLGSVRTVTDQSTQIFLGKTFVERENIHPLLPFEGDVMLEGRWGNSIRLGSTVENTPNTWSSTGENGDPITIIRNGQGNQTNEGWIPTIEDINNDDTSIYFTSTQKIPLKASSTSYSSYSSNPPTTPNEYAGRQLILNSGRLVFNTTEDHLLLSSIKTVNINALNGFNVDSPQSVIQSNSVLLGGINAVEPVLKGDTTINILVDLVNQLQALAIALQSVTPQAGLAVAPAAAQLAPQLAVIRTQLQTTTKSQVSKTL
jgi:hypothetical protein